MLEAVKVWPGKGGACCKVGVTANLDSSCARRHERSHHWEEEVDSQIKNQTMEKNAPPCLNFLTKKAPYKGLGADSEEKHEPVSDIDTVVVDSLKALDPNGRLEKRKSLTLTRNDVNDPKRSLAPR